MSGMIFETPAREGEARADLIIWDFLFSSIMASCLAVFGGWIGRKTTLTDMTLSTIGTVITLTSVIVLSDYLLLKILGFFLGLYLMFKGQAGINKKHPYLFNHPWDKS